MTNLVNEEVLEIYDKYDGDLGLLHERWASRSDRDKVSSEQASVIGEFVDKLHFIKVESLSAHLKSETLARIAQLELLIEDEVIDTLRKRLA